MRGAKPLRFLLTGSLYFPHINWRCKFVTLREFVSRATICMTCSSDLGKFYAYSPAFLRRFQDTIFPLVTTTNERARFPPDQISPKLLPSRTLLPFSSSSLPCQNDKRNLFFSRTHFISYITREAKNKKNTAPSVPLPTTPKKVKGKVFEVHICAFSFTLVACGNSKQVLIWVYS